MDGAAADGAVARDLPEVVTAIDRERREIRERRNHEVREVEGKFDGLLDKLDRVVAALSGSDGGAPKAWEQDAPQPQPQKKSRRRRRAAVSTTPAAAKERREAIFRYLIEAGRKVAPREIQRDLNLTPSSVQGALANLRKEGRVVRFGGGNGTRYEAKPGSRSEAKAQASQVGDRATLEGLILEIAEARGYASLDELVQATGYLREDVRDACGALQIQDELRMEQRNGRPVYVRHQPV
jgi:DNA-binding transcriptional ArsR family regulator